MPPNDLPPWPAMYQQFRRWSDLGCFEAMVSDMRSIIRAAQGRRGQPSAVILDGRTLQSSCESVPGILNSYKRRNGSKVHMAGDTLVHLIALTVTPANEQERAQVDALCQRVQWPRAIPVKLAWADQGYVAENGIELQVVKLPEAKQGFVLRPRRWLVEHSFG